MKLTRSFQRFNASPVVDDDGVEVGEIQGSALSRWSNHRSKRNTWTFFPNAEGTKRGLKLIRKFKDTAAPVRVILKELKESKTAQVIQFPRQVNQ